jgi:broad specificity phosphatase PhoE
MNHRVAGRPGPGRAGAPLPSNSLPSTAIHLVRHGQVRNPSGVLYGRLPDFHLSALGIAMAERVADALGDRDITYLVSSPLDRAQETIAPLATNFGLTPHVDDRLIEADNVFEGRKVGVGDGALRDPRSWRHLWNPIRPSWGEAYTALATRMLGAVGTARDAASGHEAVLVSHQLPIWILRSYVEHRRLWHDPRKRECALASITTLHYIGSDLDRVTYSEPAADLAAQAAASNEPAAGA